MSGKLVFVDTGAWYALQVTDDENHPRAREYLPWILEHFQGLLTSNHVIGETYTLLRVSRGHDKAKRFLDSVRQSPRLEVHLASHDTERKAFVLLDKYSDHPFSFVDGVSFAIMREEKIEDAFAFDVHFRIAGFKRVGIDSLL